MVLKKYKPKWLDKAWVLIEDYWWWLAIAIVALGSISLLVINTGCTAHIHLLGKYQVEGNKHGQNSSEFTEQVPFGEQDDVRSFRNAPDLPASSLRENWP